MPNEREGDVGIGCELPSLTAFVVGEEDEFTIFHAFSSTVRVEGRPSGETVAKSWRSVRSRRNAGRR